MAHKLTLQAVEPVTHDTYHLTFARPEAFDFAPGQATELTFHKDGIPGEGRPFTMVSQPGDATLEFVIKSYPDHDGVTQHVSELSMADSAEATDPFGAITDHGAGTFLAAGAGVTPFISILKKHEREGTSGDTLLFANKTDADVILEDTWISMSGITAVHVISDQEDTKHRNGRLDRAALEELAPDAGQPYYICGPGGFVDAMRDALKDMGVPTDRMVIEDGW